MLCLLVLAVLAPCAHAYALSHHQFSAEGSLPSKISLGEKESMFLYWRPTEKTLTQCRLTNPEGVIDLFRTSGQSNYVRSSILPLQDGYCSVRIKEVNGRLNGTWLLEASAGSNLNFNASTQVIVYPPPVIINTTYSVIELSTFILNCGLDKALTCKLTSPRGKHQVFYNGPCTKTVYDTNIFDHQGVWNCSFSIQDFTTEFFAQAEVHVKEDDFKEVLVKEMKDEIIFFCQSPKKKSKYSIYCQITTPYGLDLYMTPGKAYGRYTYYGFNAGYCGITIPKPLALHDKGSWKCMLAQDFLGMTKEIYGGYATIGSDNAIKEVQVESKNLFWTKYSNYIIKCHVPYIIEYCWIKSPSGTIYNIRGSIDGSINNGNFGFKFGDCAFDATSTNLTNATGTWTCNMGIAKDSVIELSTSIHVIYTESGIYTENPQVSGELGSTVELTCKTEKGYGIDYCRFIRPDGMGLTVDPLKNNSEYSYQGEGFLYGNCGIKIHYLKERDIGVWICGVKVHGTAADSNTNNFVKITLNREKGNLVALYIVIGVGGLISLLGMSYCIIRKYEFQLKNRSDESNTRLIQNDESEEDHSQNNLDRINNMVRYVRRRSPRPATSPESISSYI